MSQTIVVTGASGFIGKALTKRLLEEGMMVYAVTHSPGRLDSICQSHNLSIINVDFKDYGTLAERINHPIDVFYHLAWQGYGSHTQDADVQFQNIYYSMQVLKAAKSLQAKAFIFTGSCHQYQKKYLEEAQLFGSLCSVYGAAKTAFAVSGRVEAETYGIRFYNTLFSHIFGPGDVAFRSSSKLIYQLLHGHSLKLARANMLYDWTYIRDAVNGLYAILNSNARSAEYYIGGKQPVPFGDIIAKVRDCLVPEATLHFGVYPDNTYIDYAQIDFNALWRDTGFRAGYNFTKAIKETAMWIRENGSLFGELL